jgi:hypothetical protein
MTKSFDPAAQSYGHGNNKTGKETKSILHPDLKTIPHQPEVQLIGHGQVPGVYEGLDQVSVRVQWEATLGGWLGSHRGGVGAAWHAESPARDPMIRAGGGQSEVRRCDRSSGVVGLGSHDVPSPPYTNPQARIWPFRVGTPPTRSCMAQTMR